MIPYTVRLTYGVHGEGVKSVYDERISPSFVFRLLIPKIDGDRSELLIPTDNVSKKIFRVGSDVVEQGRHVSRVPEIRPRQKLTVQRC